MAKRDPAGGRGFQPGMIVGKKFALLQPIAEGGGGAVYEAHDLLIGRRVALKVLHPEVSRNLQLVRAFRREAKATAAVGHPNVVTIFEMGQRRDGSYYIAHELLAGISLQERLHDGSPIDLEEAIDILLPIMGALCAAHLRGIVHRDVKPGNIILARGPTNEAIPRLIDFGVAKLAAHRVTKEDKKAAPTGTPAYMAPEQVRGDHSIDGRADVWAVAIVLIELLAHQVPFPGPSQEEVFSQILEETDERLAKVLVELPEDLRPLVSRALAFNREDRFPSMAEFRRALAVYAGKPIVESAMELPAARPDVAWHDADALEPEEETSPHPSLADSGVFGSDDEDADTAGPEMPAAPRAASERPSRPSEPSSGEPYSMPPSNPELALTRQAHRSASDPAAMATAAERALGMNALDSAIELSQTVLRTAMGETRARMWLVQAVANLWLGQYVECERSARLAIREFPAGVMGWFVALGHLASVSGILGNTKAIRDLLAQLLVPGVFAKPGPARDIAACRLAIVLLRSGDGDEARALFELLEHDAHTSSSHSLVRAWMDVVRAEFAAQLGHSAVYLKRIESAVEHFAFAGDIRNTSLQRHNIGNAYMQLGAYDAAEAALRDVLEVGEPMRLNLVAPARANLGFALARLGRVDEAAEVEWSALRLCEEQGNRRFEAVAWVYLGLILGLQADNLDDAEEAARKGVEVCAKAPPLLALAKASQAGVLLMRNRGVSALPIAREAMGLLTKLGGVEEGEALIRLVHMSALASTGRDDEARKAIAMARQRLLERAERIGSTSWQKSFLENVPENARTLEFASQWLDEGRNATMKLGPQTIVGIGD